MDGATAVERVSDALERAHRTQDSVNAFISLDDDRALARAEAIDRGEIGGRMAGIPIALKDLIDHEGRVTTCGSHFYRVTAESTAKCVQGLEDQGAVIIGRANLHEWAFGFNSENEHWGAVRNPRDLETSAGGSSGGSGAAVAAGITPIAIGTDTGGSVRVPAALCGTYGLKVTHGAISLDGVFPLVPSLDTVGPLADSMDNVELAYRAMSGDERTVEAAPLLRFGIPQPWFDDAPIESGVASSFAETVDKLLDLGHQVHPIQMPNVKPSPLIIAAFEEVATVHREFRKQGRHYSKVVEDRIIAVENATPEEVLAAREWQEMIRSRFADAFASVDFLLTPSTPASKKVIGEVMIGEKHHRTVLSYFSAIVNHALRPALAVPTTVPGGPQTSVQVIGDLNSEPELIALGRRLEASGIGSFEPSSPNSPTPPNG